MGGLKGGELERKRGGSALKSSFSAEAEINTGDMDGLTATLPAGQAPQWAISAHLSSFAEGSSSQQSMDGDASP